MRRMIEHLLGMIAVGIGRILRRPITFLLRKGAARIAARSQRPWETRRGRETIDYNNNLLLIRAPVEDVARALADRTERWERDVLGREIVLGQFGVFVFRLREHSWTEVVPEFR